MFDGRRRLRSVELVRAEDHLTWAAKMLRMPYESFIDGNPITSAQEIKLSKIANISTSFMRREISFTDTVQIFLHYRWTLKEDYAIDFVDAPVLDTVNDMLSSNFLAASSNATYAR